MKDETVALFASIVGAIALLAATVGLAVSAQADTLKFKYTNPAELWRFVCEVNADDCKNLKVPVVGHAPLYIQRGLIGEFSLALPWTITVDVPAIDALFDSRVMVDSVIIHEMQHYYDFHRGKIAVPYDEPANRCAVEERGFTTQAVYLAAHESLDLIDHTWKVRYGC